MRTISCTLFSIFLLIGLVCSAYAFDGQSNINFVIEESKDPKYFVDFNVDVNAPESLPPNITPGKFTVFIWPGLQPNGEQRSCFSPIILGVLQPVLTYGNSCAPHKPQNVEQWWISGQYVNTNLDCDHVPNDFAPVCDDFVHCHGGDFLTLNPGQEINTSMVYEPSDNSWLQTIKSGGDTRTYDIALDYCSENSEPTTPVTRDPQAQTNAILSIETKGYNTPLWQSFENIQLKINVGDDQDATCDTTLSVRTTVPSSSCSTLETISNTDGILTCQVESCSICKPTTLTSNCPTSVPTLSEWGLIAMVAVLGIVGFMILRRRRASA
jgi:hypothetical protein